MSSIVVFWYPSRPSRRSVASRIRSRIDSPTRHLAIAELHGCTGLRFACILTGLRCWAGIIFPRFEKSRRSAQGPRITRRRALFARAHGVGRGRGGGDPLLAEEPEAAGG